MPEVLTARQKLVPVCVEGSLRLSWGLLCSGQWSPLTCGCRLPVISRGGEAGDPLSDATRSAVPRAVVLRLRHALASSHHALGHLASSQGGGWVPSERPNEREKGHSYLTSVIVQYIVVLVLFIISYYCILLLAIVFFK